MNRIKSNSHNVNKRIIAKVSRQPVEFERREDYLLVCSDIGFNDFEGYAGILSSKGFPTNLLPESVCYIGGIDDLNEITDGSILSISPNGHIYKLYRPESSNNFIFVTGQCNNNCLMCPQPPNNNPEPGIAYEHLRLINLIDDAPETLGLTGGEPTLLGDALFDIIQCAKDKLPETHLHMLTNGRMYAYQDYTRKIASIGHPSLMTGIPIFSDTANIHDYIVQAPGAFDQMTKGLYNAAEHGLNIELRIVLTKQTTPRLPQISEFIYRSFPFVQHVAFMGMENMGYVKKNWDLLWQDPIDYMPVLEKAVKNLFYRNINVSIYNLQHCILPESLWSFSRKSISDYKNISIDSCNSCSQINNCGGLFKSSEIRHSRGVHSI